MQTIIIVLNPGKLTNPDLDLRYLIPQTASARSQKAPYVITVTIILTAKALIAAGNMARDRERRPELFRHRQAVP